MRLKIYGSGLKSIPVNSLHLILVGQIKRIKNKFRKLMNFKKNKLISIFLIIFLIIFSLVYKIKKQIAEKPIINNFQKTIILETNLPDISNTFNNNFFIIADKFEHIYKNFVIKIMKDGVEIEIENENLKNLIISTNEDQVNYSNKLEYFVIL